MTKATDQRLKVAKEKAEVQRGESRESDRRGFFRAALAVAAGAAAVLVARPGGVPRAEASHGDTNFDGVGPNPTVHITNTGDEGFGLLVTRAGGSLANRDEAIFVDAEGDIDAIKVVLDSESTDGVDGLVADRRGSGEGYGVSGLIRQEVDGSGVRGRRDGTGPGHGVLAQNRGLAFGHGVFSQRTDFEDDDDNLFPSAGDGVRGNRRDGGVGDGVRGVRREDGVGNGVHGVHDGSGDGDAVLGEYTGDGDGAGLHGIGEWALHVEGRAKFSTGGSGTAAANAVSHPVSNENVTGESHISVSLTSNPQKAGVEWIERDPGDGFIIHFTDKLKGPTTFTYLITEPD